MSKSKNVIAEVLEVSSNEVVAEQPKTAVEAPTGPVVKQTAIEDRLYEVVPSETEIKFRGKQRQQTYDALKSSPQPLNIKDISTITAELGLTAKGGVEPSVRYHIHHLAKDGFVLCTNPTFILS